MFDNAGGRVAVVGVATLIVEGEGNGVTITVKNLGAETISVGGADVTLADGYPLVAGGALGFVGDDGDDLYGISDGTSIEVAVLRQGV